MQGLIFLAVIGMMLVSPILGVALGALAGWLVGLVFDGSLVLLAQALGIQAAPYQLGAMLGFVAGFFRK
jgi:hypothetical protein